ncbi:6-phosphogluconolactonase [Demequina pelophila]|uniref:6-phosphogluconolactonase n=1 Tax=Demequina pelophila TaxID=1638984 RepID=UPI000784746D|nr:6-phosphogluconolactonase [Demequina pelophila]
MSLWSRREHRPRVVVHPSPDAVAEATAARLLVTLLDTLSVQDRADVVLTGGTVGIATLAAVSRSPLADAIDWTSVHVWWGDERFVPAGHPDRNEGQAQAALLGALPLPEENIHRMPAAAPADAAAAFGGAAFGGAASGATGSTPGASLEAAAESYDALLREHGDPSFDVAMFGMGPDGHVASLFPGHPVFEELASFSHGLASDTAAAAALAGADAGAAFGAGGIDPSVDWAAEAWAAAMVGPRAVAVTDSPKPPPERVSLTLTAINRAKRVWIVAAGAEKADVAARALGGDAALPAAHVHGAQETLWLLDAKAAAKI